MPALTWGPRTVEALKKWTNLPLDVHMMVEQPERHIASFLDAGADIITVHAEACRDIGAAVRQIKSVGLRAGVAIRPGTPVSALDEVLVDVDHGMRVMTEENFGPVVGIMPVKSDEEALALMNDSDFGLTAAIWTRDAAREGIELYDTEDLLVDQFLGVAFNEEEQAVYDKYYPSIQTYMLERQQAWILGTGDVKEDWEGYMAALDKMGYQKVLEVMNSAYERQYGG